MHQRSGRRNVEDPVPDTLGPSSRGGGNAMADENSGAPPTTVNLGDFPFPLTKGPEESRYLTWLRNHSNYMATRGFLDYLRAVGVLVRGVLINFLILMSLLLMVSL